MSPWFTIEKIDADTYSISEYSHPEETHAYLLIGEQQSLLIDTGLGIADISAETAKLTKNPIIAVATHIHWDHIGGHRHFPIFYANKSELPWLQGKFPLSLALVKKYVSDCALPENFHIDEYSLFQGTPQKLVQDGDTIDLGTRQIEILHTPGHSPGHLCFYERARQYLFTGDLVYRGTLFANYPSTDPEAYLSSLQRIASLPTARIFPAHHSLAIDATMPCRIRDAFLMLKENGKLHHASGKYDFEDFSVLL